MPRNNELENGDAEYGITIPKRYLKLAACAGTVAIAGYCIGYRYAEPHSADVRTAISPSQNLEEPADSQPTTVESAPESSESPEPAATTPPKTDTVAAPTKLAKSGRKLKGKRYPVPSNIPSDCSRDASEQLNKWVASVPNGSDNNNLTILDLGSKKCFALDAKIPAGVNPTFPGSDPAIGAYSGIVFKERKNLAIVSDANNPVKIKFTGDSPGYPTPASQGINRGNLYFYGGENLYAQNIVIEGTSSNGNYIPGSEYNHGVRAIGTQGLSLAGLTIIKPQGDGLYVMAKGPWDGAGKGALVPKDISITDSQIIGAARQGVSLNTVDGAHIEKVTFRDGGYWPIDIEQHIYNGYINNVKIVNNVVEGKRKYGFASLMTFRQNPNFGVNKGITNITIKNNSVGGKNTENCLEGILINKPGMNPTDAGPTKNITIEDNDFKVNQYVIKATNVENISVKGNTATTRSDNNACRAQDSTQDAEKRFALFAAGVGVKSVQIGGNQLKSGAAIDKAILSPYTVLNGTRSAFAPQNVTVDGKDSSGLLDK